MDKSERTRDIYEIIPGYPKPLLLPLPAVSDLFEDAEMKQRLTPATRLLLKTGVTASGFGAFIKKLPGSIESLLRQNNLRGPALFAPAVSATLALEDDPGISSPLERAVTLLLGAYDLYKDIISAKLPPDKYKDQILEMGQYPNLFSTSIIIEKGRPRLYKSTNINQVTVAIRAQLYLIEIDDWENPSLKDRLLNCLTQLVHNSAIEQGETGKPAAGMLTCAKDTTQLKAFPVLQQDETNRNSLNALRHSFLTLCFDINDEPDTHADAIKTAHSSNFANRWGHSSLQLIVFKNAKTCALCSFSAYVDGNTMMRTVAEIQKRAALATVAAAENDESIPSLKITKLKWNIDPSFLQKAEEDLHSIGDSQQATFTIEGIGRQFFASNNMQAVPVFIVALQLAVKRLTGDMLRITQFLSMSKYRCIGLETAVMTTPEVIRIVDYIDSGDPDKSEAVPMLMEAIESQCEKAREVRRQLPFTTIFALFRTTIKGINALRAAFILRITITILRKAGIFRHLRRDIVVSHPQIYPEVPVLGRPGVRLPYVTYFGLHYQIFDDNIVITLMPGLKWDIPNPELINYIKTSLKDIQKIISGKG